MFKKKTVCLNVGLSENEHLYCLVYLYQGQPKIIWQEKNVSLNDFLELQAVNFSQHFSLIRPLSSQFIWRKYLFLPSHLNHSLVYRQIIQILQQELPIPIEEVYFDYQIQAIDSQTQRVIIYAIKQSYAVEKETLYPTILDCELFCFLRGLNYYLPIENSEMPILIQYKYYQFKTEGINIMDKYNGDFLSLDKISLTEDILDPYLYLTALGACLWNGKA